MKEESVFDRVVSKEGLGSQAELARVCGITHGALVFWPSGVILPKYANKVAKELEDRGKLKENGAPLVTVEEMLEAYDEHLEKKARA